MSNLVRLPKTYGADAPSVEDIEISLLLEGLFRLYGYDFRQYASNSIKRRLHELMKSHGLKSVSALQDVALRDVDILNRLVSSLSVQASDLFRDPAFFLTFREKVVPILRTYPLVRIWHAGCSTGEEVYSMAILLMEEQLLSRSLLYGTDINTDALVTASKGTYTTRQVAACEANYKKAGGKERLSRYFELEDQRCRIIHSMSDNIVFTRHNLVTDSSFNEFNVILCRNVLMYFTKELRHRVHSLLHSSLARFGILGLGAQETLRFTAFEQHYRQLDETSSLYRRVN